MAHVEQGPTAPFTENAERGLREEHEENETAVNIQQDDSEEDELTDEPMEQDAREELTPVMDSDSDQMDGHVRKPVRWAAHRSANTIPGLSDLQREELKEPLTTLAAQYLTPDIPWSQQSQQKRAEFLEQAGKNWPFLQQFEDAWPAESIMRQRLTSHCGRKKQTAHKNKEGARRKRTSSKGKTASKAGAESSDKGCPVKRAMSGRASRKRKLIRSNSVIDSDTESDMPLSITTKRTKTVCAGDESVPRSNTALYVSEELTDFQLSVVIPQGINTEPIASTSQAARHVPATSASTDDLEEDPVEHVVKDKAVAKMLRATGIRTKEDVAAFRAYSLHTKREFIQEELDVSAFQAEELALLFD
ncbi:hypothetical protein NM688_g9351 [Phlebia brevispora]|uniref:Uncharacterized protein n=1 Tax=Phlebia brevispora TaxID=194682 RepID=A0ACC1RHB1_9APHY|nr:hypothetical protein NM688_g9351 [Phlebia brevispora]